MTGFKIPSLEEMKITCDNYRTVNKKIVFTNGCFDILHSGHVDYLNKAKECGDVLVVAINSDKSVKNIKGHNRPILNETDRAFLVYNLKAVDHVLLFDEDTPINVIETLIPDVLVKGADWDENKIVGRETVLSHGGKIQRIDFVSQLSTSKIIDIILTKHK